MVEVVVKDVLWNVTRNGYWKPIITFDPIILLGTEVEKVTGFNGKYIVDNIIGQGAVIKVAKTGYMDIIPQVQEVVEPAPNGKPKLPDSPYEWTKTKVDLIGATI